MKINMVSENKLTSGRIREEKLYGEFRGMSDLRKLSYVRDAINISKRLMDGEEVNIDEIAKLRIEAVNDTRNLKGDFVLSVFLHMEEQWRRNRGWGKGRTMLITEDEIYRILKNDYTKELSALQFCREEGITDDRYYKIRNSGVKQESTLKKIEKARERLSRGIREGRVKKKSKGE